MGGLCKGTLQLGHKQSENQGQDSTVKSTPA